MSMICPHCQQHLEFLGVRPRFCSHCGQPLDAEPAAVAVKDLAEAATLPPRQPGDTEPLPPTVAGNDLLQTVGPYHLVRPLGGGGMGTVYEAEDMASGRHVALKLIRPEYATSPEALQRFRQEGELASKLAHPRCVFVLAADEDRGQPYIVMELMTGSTLEDLVKKNGPLPPEQALRKILDVIEGLHEAHQLGLIHRDVKPSNCFVEENGRVKVGDFGLAKSLLRPVHLTHSGTFVGTPLYAAPEQIKMEAVDARSDVYSVAATLYFLLTGRAPFQTGDPMATIARIVADDAPSLRTLRPDLPKALDRVVRRGLERDPKRRWRSLEEFREALLILLPAEPSVGGLGLRLAAFGLDELLIFLAHWCLAPGLQMLVTGFFFSLVADLLERTILTLAYFGALEGIWGYSLGKRLLRLHIGTGDVQRAPGVGRALLRSGILCVFLNLGEIAFIVPFALLHGDHVSQIFVAAGGGNQPDFPLQRFLFYRFGMFLLDLLGAGLLMSTMRQRNGYRGLHEFLSDTRTYRLRWPQPRKRRPLAASEFPVDVQEPAEAPDQVGPYRIRGALRCTGEHQTLIGDDMQLGRTVWIELRPETEARVTEARRAVARTTRVRWVSSGTLPGRQWDAFLAPLGCPLPALVGDGRRLSWAQFRGILTDLVEELQAACAEDTLPMSLALEQIWITPAGRAQLVETSWVRAAAETSAGQHPQTNDQRRYLDFLRDVAVLALEGRARSVETGKLPIRAPLPLHAAHLVNRLSSDLWDSSGARHQETFVADPRTGEPEGPYERLDQLQSSLLATEPAPVEVTRLMRALQLGEQAAYAVGVTLGSFILLGFAVLILVAQGRGETVTRITFALTLSVPPLLLCSLLISSYVTRGGLSFLRHGIAVVRADGRPASRLRCVWRSTIASAVIAMVFIAYVGLLAISGRAMHIRLPWLRGATTMFAASLFVGYVGLMFRNPARAPHDIVADTYLVPR